MFLSEFSGVNGVFFTISALATHGWKMFLCLFYHTLSFQDLHGYEYLQLKKAKQKHLQKQLPADVL